MSIKRMLDDKVLMRPVKVSETSTGGLYVPEEARGGGVRKAEVISVGPGRRNSDGVRMPVDMKPGEIVLLAPMRGIMLIEVDGEKMWIANESDILAVEE